MGWERDGLEKGWVEKGMSWERDGLVKGWVGKRMTGELNKLFTIISCVLSLYIHLHRTANSGSFQVQV